MTDAVHTARPPGSDEASTEYLKGTPEPAEAAEPDADSCELVGGDGSETAGPAERPGRRKGLPWTEAEHRDFLLGLQKLGKGDWRGISRHYVVTRTPTQVASHAQKHFIRQQTLSKRKRRASLFDITGEDDDAQLDAHGALHPQGGTTAAQPQAQRQQQAQQGQQAQPQQQQFMPPAMQQMPQFGGPMQGMPGFGYGHPMQQAAAAQAAAAAAAQGWNPNAGGPGFMGQQQQFQNYFQFAQQQQAAAGAMYLAQQQHQQQQAAMAAFMQHHGCGAGGFGPQGFGGQGFGFGAPGMVHMVPHYQQAMFSQPSVNASMQSAGTVQQPRHTQHTISR